LDTTRPSLLLRIKNPRDQAAWGVFDDIYRPLLRRYAASCGLHADDAEEVVQRCMVAINAHIAGFEYDPRRGRFKSWLRTMMNNKARDMFRDRRARPCGIDKLQGVASAEAAPDEEFDRLWMQEHLWHCLRQVRAEVEESTYRAFEAYVIEQRSIEDVCATLGVKPNLLYTIKWRMTEKIGAKLRELLGDDAEV
jgi:RNA polymerase sigma-70 factor (ECF subfamily)